MPPTSPTPLHEDLSHTLADSARYALLRRLAPSLRHEAVAPLQPIAMAAGVLERRLRDPAPDLALVQETSARLAGYSRAAVQSCLELLDWLTPTPAHNLSLQASVQAALALLRGSFAFRGFTLRDEVQEARADVQGASLRYVLPACLLWLTDSAGSPAEVTLRTHATGGPLQLVLDLQPTEGAAGAEDAPAYRPLREDEVRALAQADGIGLVRTGDTLSLTFTAPA